jgi:hypothetical protein
VCSLRAIDYGNDVPSGVCVGAKERRGGRDSLTALCVLCPHVGARVQVKKHVRKAFGLNARLRIYRYQVILHGPFGLRVSGLGSRVSGLRVVSAPCSHIGLAPSSPSLASNPLPTRTCNLCCCACNRHVAPQPDGEQTFRPHMDDSFPMSACVDDRQPDPETRNPKPETRNPGNGRPCCRCLLASTTGNRMRTNTRAHERERGRQESRRTHKREGGRGEGGGLRETVRGSKTIQQQSRSVEHFLSLPPTGFRTLAPKP